MGWSHALWICQRIHERSVRSPLVRPDCLVADRRPAPDLTHGAHAEYVDNFVALGLRKNVVEALAREAASNLEKVGLPVQMDLESSDCADVLGMHFSQGFVTTSKRRRWRIRLAVQALLARGIASGEQLSRVIGHYTFAALLKRAALSVLHLSYAFMQRHWDHPAHLWPGVVRELRWAVGMLPLLEQRLDAPWLGEILCTDTSEEGRGVLRKDLAP